jgi:xylulokinase
MQIGAPQAGWAEQNPEHWWEYLVQATKKLLSDSGVNSKDVKAIGVAYQMHGLVLVDKDRQILRPAIIWCDSRAVKYGEQAFCDIGEKKCLTSLLNSPGNFTASKLKWVRENEPEIYRKIYKIMLPGDYIAMKLTGNINTTPSGLSEAILWDFEENTKADFLLKYYGLDEGMIPDIVPTFSSQGKLTKEAAEQLNLHTAVEVSYRAGDQPNNAFSLNVLEPGEIAATAGTSGVIFGVSDQAQFDPRSRVNTFLHVNNSLSNPRNGVLLCLNGVGIQYAWLKNLIGSGDYELMNKMASEISAGADGLLVHPFGNGAERVLENKNAGATISNINFNIHNKKHLTRAALEGIVFAFYYGIDIMKETGIHADKIRAGHANLFLSKVFSKSLASISGAVIELFDTDGSQGAARGAGMGINYYRNASEAFSGLKLRETIYPDKDLNKRYIEIYKRWLKIL